MRSAPLQRAVAAVRHQKASSPPTSLRELTAASVGIGRRGQPGDIIPSRDLQGLLAARRPQGDAITSVGFHSLSLSPDTSGRELDWADGLHDVQLESDGRRTGQRLCRCSPGGAVFGRSVSSVSPMRLRWGGAARWSRTRGAVQRRLGQGRLGVVAVRIEEVVGDSFDGAGDEDLGGLGRPEPVDGVDELRLSDGAVAACPPGCRLVERAAAADGGPLLLFPEGRVALAVGLLSIEMWCSESPWM